MKQLNLYTGKDKEQIAIEFLKDHEPLEGYFVGFSGGKDSIVLYDLVKKSGVKFQAYYSCTGIDAPEVVKFIRDNYPDVIWLKPFFRMPKKYPDWKGTHSFFGMIPKKGQPMRTKRWCCDILKKNPSKNIPLKHRLMGIRAEESARRASRPMIDTYHNGQTLYKPIFYWLEWEIWEYIDENSLPYCSLYDEGFTRLGCVICPFICSTNQKNIEKHRQRWPKYFVAFEKAMKKLWDEGKQKGCPWRRGKTFAEFLDNWYKGK